MSEGKVPIYPDRKNIILLEEKQETLFDTCPIIFCSLVDSLDLSNFKNTIVSVGLDDDLLDFSKKKKKKKKAFDLTDMDDALPVSIQSSALV